MYKNYIKTYGLVYLSYLCTPNWILFNNLYFNKLKIKNLFSFLLINFVFITFFLKMTHKIMFKLKIIFYKYKSNYKLHTSLIINILKCIYRSVCLELQRHEVQILAKIGKYLIFFSSQEHFTDIVLKTCNLNNFRRSSLKVLKDLSFCHKLKFS